MRLWGRLSDALKSLLVINRIRFQANAAVQEFGRLAALENRIEQLEASFTELFTLTRRISRTEDLNGRIQALESATGKIRDQLGVHARQIAVTASGLDRLPRSPAPASAIHAAPAPGPEISAVLESFYVALEARFRGSLADITQRQLVYLPDVEQACASTGLNTVLDIGCGRGEWLRLLAEQNIQGIGVDTNEGQLAQAREHGLAVTNQDGLEFLRAQPEGRFAVVSAFHIFEHLPFTVLAEWLVEIQRVLCPGGILIAETPNPETLLVGANSFYLDPTHVRPLPSGLLATLVETVGLKTTAIRPLHPHARLKDALQQIADPIAYLLFGYQDYGLIAERPSARAH